MDLAFLPCFCVRECLLESLLSSDASGVSACCLEVNLCLTRSVLGFLNLRFFRDGERLSVSLAVTAGEEPAGEEPEGEGDSLAFRVHALDCKKVDSEKIAPPLRSIFHENSLRRDKLLCTHFDLSCSLKVKKLCLCEIIHLMVSTVAIICSISSSTMMMIGNTYRQPVGPNIRRSEAVHQSKTRRYVATFGLLGWFTFLGMSLRRVFRTSFIRCRLRLYDRSLGSSSLASFGKP